MTMRSAEEYGGGGRGREGGRVQRGTGPPQWTGGAGTDRRQTRSERDGYAEEKTRSQRDYGSEQKRYGRGQGGYGGSQAGYDGGQGGSQGSYGSGQVEYGGDQGGYGGGQGRYGIGQAQYGSGQGGYGSNRAERPVGQNRGGDDTPRSGYGRTEPLRNIREREEEISGFGGGAKGKSNDVRGRGEQKYGSRNTVENDSKEYGAAREDYGREKMVFARGRGVQEGAERVKGPSREEIRETPRFAY